MHKTIAEKISEFCQSLNFESIPLAVLEKTKDLVLDTVGISIASSKLDFGISILELVQSWRGVPESSLVGSQSKVPAQNAAFANGVLGHGLDYDDTHTESVVHPSACLVPVALAVGEQTGKSGKEIISALVSGLEVMIRLGMPATNRFHIRGFHTTSICGTFASSLVAGKLIGLDHEKMNNSLGISGSFTSGLLECLSYGSWAKRLHAGWAGLCGIVSAQLAQSLYTGPMSIFEGRLGLYNSFLRSEQLNLDAIFKGLGDEWEVLNIRPKLYPCCHYLQAFLDCIAFLQKENSIEPQSIRKIICRVSEGAANIVCEPWEKKLSPETGYDARFSLPYAVSMRLIKNKSGLDEFSEKYLQDLEIRSLMQKITYEIEPSFSVKDMPGAVKMILENGMILEHQIPQVRGDAEHPITREELLEKFHSNCGTLFFKDKCEQISEMILNLEKIENIEQLSDIMAFRGDMPYLKEEAILDRIKGERGHIHPSREIIYRMDPHYLELYHELFTHVVKKESSLSLKAKEMIILAINAANNYEEGLRVHIRAALEAGASEEEIFDAIETASLPAGIHAMTFSLPIFEEVCQEFKVRSKKR